VQPMDVEVTKCCTTCKAWKPLSQFCKKSDMVDGHSSRCRQCIQAANRKRYHDTQKPLDMRIAFKRSRPPLHTIGIGAVGHAGTLSRMTCRNLECRFTGEENLHVKGVCVHCRKAAPSVTYSGPRSPVENLARSR
jgi:hypothetical protein